jgi:cytoskeleton protein RodZ
VRDSSGASLLQRKLAAGETVTVGGSMPMAVVVGRADATEVIVHGKPFDLLAVSRENVARFEVK